MIKKLTLLITVLYCHSFSANAQNNDVKLSGAMRNVMKKGDLSSTIHLDTLSYKKHLYGLGPKEKLKGELLVIDGESYVSAIDDKGNTLIEKTFNVKAPFFVYTNNEDWTEIILPKSIKNIQDLENFLLEKSKNTDKPFVFKLKGTFKKIRFHIQNLPEGTVIKSPKDAHTNQSKFERTNCSGDIVGFFSTKHQTLFTHHDSFVHMHYINDDRTEMGHIDDLFFKRKIKLYIPKNI